MRQCWAFGQAAEGSNDARLARLRRGRGGSAVTIVHASPDDAEAILTLQKVAYEREARRYDDWTIPPLLETLDSVRDQIAQHVVLKAVVDGRLVGSVRGVVTDRVCEVCRLSVDPEVQRRGIGSALIVAIEQRFPDIEAFELFTGDRSVENLRLYDRHGYVETRRRAVSPAVSLVYLRKTPR
jgi:ribosomal protein S18 acetylase RimI-like enzyme